ncbi:hypothetical protein VUR80DRAFT_6062 [Thermomyces stellatus]
MTPDKPLPYSDEFRSPDEYIDALLHFTSTSRLNQTLCGGVHILDFFTSEQSLFQSVLPPEWHDFLAHCGPMDLVRLLAHDDLDGDLTRAGRSPPKSFVEYVRTVRRLSLRRSFTPKKQKLPVIPRLVSLGMNPKKIHEVTNFADYVDRLVEDMAREGHEITHLVDFGSGQNYLGRTLASPPYDHHVVAVESREENIAGAKALDMMAGISKKPAVLRNKKLYQQMVDNKTPEDQLTAKARRRIAKNLEVPEDANVDLRALKDIAADVEYEYGDGKGYIQYVEGRLNSGDLGHVIAKIDGLNLLGGDREDEEREVLRREQKLMAISIHSCGNLSHFGIRSLVLNPSIRAVAIVGCCYNLLTERLGPPTFKSPLMRPTLQPLNGKIMEQSSKFDPEGFPMSERFVNYKGGVRLNITARMLACQSFANWTERESQRFFYRHFYRAVLQRIFLDRGVVGKVRHLREDAPLDGSESPFEVSTNPVILGSLRKQAYNSFKDYVRAAVAKLITDENYKDYAATVKEKMGDMTDEEIQAYEDAYGPRITEVSAMWTLMAFSACVVEALIVADRWLFLKEHTDIVKHAWVEPVFDYALSPRNLVVVGIKR